MKGQYKKLKAKKKQMNRDKERDTNFNQKPPGNPPDSCHSNIGEDGPDARPVERLLIGRLLALAL